MSSQSYQPNAIGSVIPIIGGGGGGGGGSSSGFVVSASGAFGVPSTVSVGDVVYVTGANTADRADNTSSLTTPAIGVVIAKPTTVTATVLYFGEAAVFAGLLPGVEYFVGLAGAVTTTAPSSPNEVVQRVGVALNPTTLLVNPDPTTVVL